MAETELEFVERMYHKDAPMTLGEIAHLFALARRGAGIVVNEWPKTGKPSRKVADILAELDALPSAPGEVEG